MQENQFYPIDKEQLLWICKPKAGIFFTQHDLFIIPLSFIFIPAYIYIVKAFLKTPNINLDWNLFYTVTAFISVFIVYVYITFGRKIQSSYYKLNVTYIITNNRIMVWDEISKKYVFNKNYSEINPTLLKTINGNSSIDLGKYISEESLNSYKYGWANQEVIHNRLEGICNANIVYKLLLKTKSEYKKKSISTHQDL